MQQDIRIALEVHLYEDTLYHLHLLYKGTEREETQVLIRRFEANAYEVTWKRPNPVKPWHERDPFEERFAL